MTSDIDIDNLFKKFAILDAELKELKKEIGEIKWFVKHGTTGAVAYCATTSVAQRYPGEEEWRENFK